MSVVVVVSAVLLAGLLVLNVAYLAKAGAGEILDEVDRSDAEPDGGPGDGRDDVSPSPSTPVRIVGLDDEAAMDWGPQPRSTLPDIPVTELPSTPPAATETAPLPAPLPAPAPAPGPGPVPAPAPAFMPARPITAPTAATANPIAARSPAVRPPSPGRQGAPLPRPTRPNPTRVRPPAPVRKPLPPPPPRNK